MMKVFSDHQLQASHQFLLPLGQIKKNSWFLIRRIFFLLFCTANEPVLRVKVQLTAQIDKNTQFFSHKFSIFQKLKKSMRQLFWNAGADQKTGVSLFGLIYIILFHFILFCFISFLFILIRHFILLKII